MLNNIKYYTKHNKKDKLCIKNNIKLFRINESSCYFRHYLKNIKTQLINYLNDINAYCKTSISVEQIYNITDEEVYEYISNSILDKNKIEDITQKYNDYKEFKTSEKSLYCKLIELGSIKEFTSHMKKDIVYWDIKLCQEEINKYPSFEDFYKNSYKCYIQFFISFSE